MAQRNNRTTKPKMAKITRGADEALERSSDGWPNHEVKNQDQLKDQRGSRIARKCARWNHRRPLRLSG